MNEFNIGFLVERANESRHIKTTAKHVSAMIDSPNVDLVAALWPDPTEPHGAGITLVKGIDLIEKLKEKKRCATLATVAFWLRDEDHLLTLRDEVARLVEQATTVRGEFLPIADDLAFEAVPDTNDPDAIYVTKAGRRIARRGLPGTREAKRWIALIPGCSVRDITRKKIEVSCPEVARFHIMQS
jgi:hypothetical protein